MDSATVTKCQSVCWQRIRGRDGLSKEFRSMAGWRRCGVAVRWLDLTGLRARYPGLFPLLNELGSTGEEGPRWEESERISRRVAVAVQSNTNCEIGREEGLQVRLLDCVCGYGCCRTRTRWGAAGRMDQTGPGLQLHNSRRREWPGKECVVDETTSRRREKLPGVSIQGGRGTVAYVCLNTAQENKMRMW